MDCFSFTPVILATAVVKMLTRMTHLPSLSWVKLTVMTTGWQEMPLRVYSSIARLRSKGMPKPNLNWDKSTSMVTGWPRMPPRE